MQKTLLFLGALGFCTQSFAYDKQFDMGFKIIDIDTPLIDSHYEVHTHGTFYFDPVQTQKGPWNELAFLGKNSNFSLIYDYTYIDSNTFDDLSIETDLHTLGLGLEYFQDQLYGELALSYDQAAVTVDVGELRGKDHEDGLNYRALIGYFPAPDFLLAAGLDGYNNDVEDDTRVAFKAKYVTALNNMSFVNVEAEAAFGDNDDVFIAADYYPNRQVSVGLGYRVADADDEDEVLQIRSQYFFNPKFALTGVVGFGSDVQLFSLTANMRF